MPFKKSKNRKKKDAAKEKSDSEDIDFDCEVNYGPKFLSFLIPMRSVRDFILVLDHKVAYR
jgi:hypothetical protein